MVKLRNSNVHTKCYNLVIGHRKICGAAGSAAQDNTNAPQGATVVDAKGCNEDVQDDVTGRCAHFMRREKGGQGCSSPAADKIMLLTPKHLHVLVPASDSGVPDTFPS